MVNDKKITDPMNSFLLTTLNFSDTTPIKFILNTSNNTVSIKLQEFNNYGNVDKLYSLVSCNFNVDTYEFIEKTSNSLGTFLLNVLCVDSDHDRKMPKNNINFNIEFIELPENYLKNKYIFDLDN